MHTQVTEGRLTAKDRQLVERYAAAITDLERKLFPHQESEPEQESFTEVGRLRVAEWIDAQLQQWGWQSS